MSREFDFLTPAYFAAMAGLWQRAQAARGVATSAEDQTATLELLRERATKSDAWFAGSWSDGRLVAIVHGANARSNDGAGESVAGLMHLSMVAVDPDRWGRGIGRAATSFALTQARVRGYDAVQLWAHLHNTRARRLYESFGFIASGRRKRDGPGSEILHYVLTL